MRYTVASDVRFRRVLDEGVVLRQEEGEVMGLNLVGLRILELIREGKDEKEIVAAVLAEHEADRETVASDVGAFLAELLELGVVSVAGSEADGI